MTMRNAVTVLDSILANLRGRVVPVRGVLIVGLLAGCTADGYNPLQEYELVTPTSLSDTPIEPGPASLNVDRIARGKYLAELLACATCHTNGALVGTPDLSAPYGGSRIGIAYSNPFEQHHPGVVYPANITPDPITGIGTWTDEEIVQLIRTGIDRHARHQLSVMPWPGYTRMKDDDALAITAFLRSLKPVRHRVPANVSPGTPAKSPYVHFGVYRSRGLANTAVSQIDDEE